MEEKNCPTVEQAERFSFGVEALEVDHESVELIRRRRNIVKDNSSAGATEQPFRRIDNRPFVHPCKELAHTDGLGEPTFPRASPRADQCKPHFHQTNCSLSLNTRQARL